MKQITTYIAVTHINCRQCGSGFEIRDRDRQFYAKVGASQPTLCPRCRMQKRMAYRNERTLYPDNCAKCQKPMLSMYKAEDGFTVYCITCWWKDDWDATQYGREIDWDRSLLEQWDELRRVVPRLAVGVMNSENCDYTNMTGDNKNCYLLFAAENNENCSYGKLVQDCKDCFDCNFTYSSELCYQCVNVCNCYRSLYLDDCTDSRECGFSIGLRGCSNVFLSSNLHNKEYYIENQPVSKEEYTRRVAEFTKDYAAIQACVQKWRALNTNRTVKYANTVKSDGCAGDYLVSCKRVYDCYDVTGGQDCSYVTDALDPRDTYDASFIYYQPELVYDSMSMLQCYNVQYSVFAYYCSDVQYGDQVHNAKNLFLSSCVRGKEYLILNKPYSPEAYAITRQKAIEKMKADGEYGELPDMRHSLFRYNDTVAYEYFPLEKTEAVKLGLRWNDETDQSYQGAEGIPANQLPSTINEVGNDIVNSVILCQETRKAYKITKSELEFYKEMKLPLPRVHPEFRHRWRMSLRNPRKLWQRQCQCEQTDHAHPPSAAPAAQCANQFATTFSEERPECVYCEECYHKTFY